MGWVCNHANPRNVGRLLRPSGERRNEEAAGQGAHKCPPVHHSIT